MRKKLEKTQIWSRTYVTAVLNGSHFVLTLLAPFKVSDAALFVYILYEMKSAECKMLKTLDFLSGILFYFFFN